MQTQHPPELSMSMFASRADYAKATRGAVTAALNIHPNWRSLSLAHIRMVRAMMREGRQVIDCRRVIKNAQRDMTYCRKAIASALAA